LDKNNSHTLSKVIVSKQFLLLGQE